jgi:hypothetical protein
MVMLRQAQHDSGMRHGLWRGHASTGSA